MKITPLNKDNIDCVFSSLSKTSKDDADRLGITINQMKDEFIRAIGKPFTAAFYNDKGECCLLFRLHAIGLHKNSAYFVDREGLLNTILMPFTRFMKDISDRLVYDGESVELPTFAVDTQTVRWFGIMGFTKCVPPVRSDGIFRFIKGGE